MLTVSSYVGPMSIPALRMSEVIIQKVAVAMRCTCGHLWLTASKARYPTCPRCHTTISRKKHAVILESDTAKAFKEKASSEFDPQNAANEKVVGNHEQLQGRQQ
jgi:hypothetical protein